MCRMAPPALTLLAVFAAIGAFKLFGLGPLAGFLAGAVFMEGSYRLTKGYWRH